MKQIVCSLAVLFLLPCEVICAADATLAFDDPHPQRYELAARASQIDASAREHPEIDFVFTKQGKPSDTEHAAVDTRVPPRGKLVIWLMGYGSPLFERVSGYGLHAIQVHYANGWFGKLSKQAPASDDKFLGKIRLEAATGEDFSDAVNIPKPDGMMECAFQFVKWLAKENPQGRWEFFLADDRKGLRWDRVIMAGSSHGSTTAARFGIHQRVDRVVMFCGPRDQYETWQSLPSATPSNRFFGFSHVLDGGWTDDHYCRSWELLGLQKYGPIVNVDQSQPPYDNTRRLITSADVKNDVRRAHSSVTPGGAAVKDAQGRFVHEAVWRVPVHSSRGCHRRARRSRSGVPQGPAFNKPETKGHELSTANQPVKANATSASAVLGRRQFLGGLASRARRATFGSRRHERHRCRVRLLLGPSTECCCATRVSRPAAGFRISRALRNRLPTVAGDCGAACRGKRMSRRTLALPRACRAET